MKDILSIVVFFAFMAMLGYAVSFGPPWPGP